MKISLDWLSDFVTFTEKDVQKIAARITEAVAEVDDVVEQGAFLKNCCVGKILSIAKHPNADKLSLCEVKTDRGIKKVVCGGTNLRKGMKVAFAHVRATVLGPKGEPFPLTQATIRGETSDGMLCAAGELDLADRYPPTSAQGDRPIIDLGDGEGDVGSSLATFVGAQDTVLHIDNHAITHRADLFSHIGFARECVAIGIAKWKKKPAYKLPKFPKTAFPFKVHNDCSDLVPRYIACMLSIDGMGKTPDWMRKRLEATGWRSVSLPVDITNYVTTEVGMPLHSFDAGDFQGDIRIRRAKKNEKITTLDGVARALPEGAIVISDDAGIFDLLGIMGGLRSSTKDTTKHVYLHSAILDPVSIRRTIIATGHRTDAATVYEKGVPRITAVNGFTRALELFLDLVPGVKLTSRADSSGTDGKATKISLSCNRVRSMLGIELSSKNIKESLKGLEFSVTGSGDTLNVSVPLHRLGDIRGSHDLVEEVGRVYGYNSIKPVLPHGSIEPPARDFRTRIIRRALKEQGYMEFLPLSLLGPELLVRCNMDPAKAVAIENPIGEEVSLMQPCVLPRLLDHAQRNMTQVEDELRSFHVGTIFEDGGDVCIALGAMVAQKRSTDLLHDPFLLLKAQLLEAFSVAGHTVTVQRVKTMHGSAHPGRCADVLLGDKKIGWLFEVHPSIRERFDIAGRAAAALVDLSALLIAEPTTIVAKSLPRFPAVTYDVTVTMDHGKEVGATLAKIKATSKLLESVEVADLYTGKTLDRGQYNLTLRCTYRTDDRTLTEAEAQAEHAKIVQLLGQV